ncbi:hypothetical protein ACQEU6_32220 [Spirillospora sp. CA-108201]
MTPYDVARIQRELEGLDTAANTTAKGNNLQHLTDYLLSQIPGVTIRAKNILDHTRSDEKDLWIRHSGVCGLPFSDLYLPVECKNEQRSTSASEIRDFAAKIRYSSGTDGLLVTRAGLSGAPGHRAHDAIHLELANQVRITVITCADVGKLTDTDDLVELLNERFFELRSNKTYVSI